jgi:hypothetical protein
MSSVIVPQPDSKSSPAPLSAEKGATEVPANEAPPAAVAPTPVAPAAALVPTGVQNNGMPNYIVPTCFARKPPPGVTYTQFQPMNVASIGKYLNKGFPKTIPISDLDPHAFVERDVQQEEWLRYIVLQGVSISMCLSFLCFRFIGDLTDAGQLSPTENMSAGWWFFLAGLLGGI